MHDFFLMGVLRSQHPREAPFVEYGDAVGQAHDFGQLRADQDHADALGGQAVHELIDRILGAHVDAARGFIEDDHAGLAEQPLADGHLLLVAAGEQPGDLVGARGADAERLDEVLRGCGFGAGIDEPGAPAHRAHVGQRDVLRHRHLHRQAIGLPVLRYVGDALADRVAGAADGELLAVQADRAAILGVGAEEGPGDLGAPRAHEACEPEDLAALEIEAHGGENAPAVQVADLEDRLRLRLAGARRELVFQRTPHHHRYDAVHRGLGEGAAAGAPAVAQHGHPVHDLRHLVEAVGDIDDAHAAGLEFVDDLEQLRRLRFGQRRGRLVHDQDRGIHREGLGDLDHLLLGHRQRLHQSVRADVHPQPVEASLRIRAQPCPVDEPAAPGLACQVDVFRHRQVRDQVQFLVDDDDSQPLGHLGRGELHRIAAEGDASAIGLVHPAHDLHEGGLARTVLAAQGMHFACVDFEIHAVQHGRAVETLADSFELQERHRAASVRAGWEVGLHGCLFWSDRIGKANVP